MSCPSCGHENPAGARFCVQCATALATRYAACGGETPPGARFCPGCAAPLASSGTPPPDATHGQTLATGERRQLTVLFSDLVGSTELSTQLDPEEWRDLVAQYHGATADVVTRFGGHVAKYLRDGVLALFGYPQAHEDDAERAVRAGLAAVEAVQRLAVTRLGEETSSHEPLTANRLSVRIGIHTGLTVIADAGSTKRPTA
jgi:class 3 adenylate cyclase